MYSPGVMSKVKTVSNVIFYSVRSFHKKQSACESERANKFDLRIAVKLFDRQYKNLKPVVEVKPRLLQYQEPAFLFPGFEGRKSCIEPLLDNLHRPVYCVQYPFEGATGNTMDVAVSLFPLLKECIRSDGPVKMVAHSFGGLVAFDMIKLLESEGRKVQLCLSDSSPYALKVFGTDAFGDIHATDFETQFLSNLMVALGVRNIEQYQDIVNSSNQWNDKVEALSARLEGYCSFTPNDVKVFLIGFYNLVKSMLLYDEFFDKLKCDATLIRPTGKIWKFPEDYNISQHFEKPVKTFWTDGHHVSMLKQKKTTYLINQILEGNESSIQL